MVNKKVIAVVLIFAIVATLALILVNVYFERSNNTAYFIEEKPSAGQIGFTIIEGSLENSTENGKN